LKLTSPGVPDLYQGTEYWDFSLVDPDNRRPVDFAARQASLAADIAPATLLQDWRDGRVKQAILARALRFRSESAGLFTEGAYSYLKLEGPRADHLLAFARVHEGRAAITVVTRLPAHLPGSGARPLADASAWDGTFVVAPRNLIGRRIVDVLATDITHGKELTARVPVGDILATLPVALLEVG
jgi:(1->4)-alpha-D-glucan 1-alpha-D-glucosylmutase